MEKIRKPLPWIHDHHEYGEDEHEEPEVHEEEVAAPMDDLDDDGDEGKHDDLPHDEFLDLFGKVSVLWRPYSNKFSFKYRVIFMVRS